MHSERVSELRAELRELKQKPNYDASDPMRLDEIGEAIAKTIADKGRKEVLDSLGAPPELPGSGGFADAIRMPDSQGRGERTPSPSNTRLRASTATYHATLALAAGARVDVVSRQLGHASIAITADVYGHPDDDAQSEAAAKVRAVLDR